MPWSPEGTSGFKIRIKMLNYYNEREQLERLHDRHKRLSLGVFDHLNKEEETDLVEAHKALKKVEKELEEFKKKLFAEFASKKQ